MKNEYLPLHVHPSVCRHGEADSGRANFREILYLYDCQDMSKPTDFYENRTKTAHSSHAAACIFLYVGESVFCEVRGNDMNITTDTQPILLFQKDDGAQPGNLLFLLLLKEVSTKNLPPQLFLLLLLFSLHPHLIFLHASNKTLIVNLVFHETTAGTAISRYLQHFKHYRL